MKRRQRLLPRTTRFADKAPPRVSRLAGDILQDRDGLFARCSAALNAFRESTDEGQMAARGLATVLTTCCSVASKSVRDRPIVGDGRPMPDGTVVLDQSMADSDSGAILSRVALQPVIVDEPTCDVPTTSVEARMEIRGLYRPGPKMADQV